MKIKADEKSNPGAPLRVLAVGGWGSNWKIKAVKIPRAKRYPITLKRRKTVRRSNSGAPLRVIVVGGWGSNWTVKSEKIPGAYKYPTFKKRRKKD